MNLHRSSRGRGTLAVLALLALLAACSSTGRETAHPPVAQRAPAPLATTAGAAIGPAVEPAEAARRIAALAPAPVILLGEQHDANAHQQIQAATLQRLAAQGRLAALVMEMADAGRSTAGVGRDASAEQVRAALQWNDQAWPWARYADVVMSAVRAGVVVAGGNLPRSQMRAAMADAGLDARLGAAALAEQRRAIADGHCGLLPDSQIGPMTRIQIARDVAMAQAIEAQRQAAARPDASVVLVAGAGHVLRHIGVPLHLPAGTRAQVVVARTLPAQPAAAHAPALPPGSADLVVWTPALPERDYCASLRR